MATCNNREITEADMTIAKQNVTEAFAAAKEIGSLPSRATLDFEINHPGHASVSKKSLNVIADPAAFACLDKSETKAVILHEAGHIHYGYDLLLTPLLMAQLLFTAAAGVGLVFTLAAGLQKRPKVAAKRLMMVGAVWAAQIGTGRFMAEINRGEELAADRYAAQRMGEGKSMANALRKLDYYQPTYSEAPEIRKAEENRYFKAMIFSNLYYGAWGMYVTHPSTQERARQIENYRAN